MRVWGLAPVERERACARGRRWGGDERHALGCEGEQRLEAATAGSALPFSQSDVGEGREEVLVDAQCLR
jgi:hypothetical protein